MVRKKKEYMEVCENCSRSRKDGLTIFPKLTNKLQKLKLTIAEAFHFVFGDLPENFQTKYLCHACYVELIHLYTSYVTFLDQKTRFTNATSSDSFVAQHLRDTMGMDATIIVKPVQKVENTVVPTPELMVTNPTCFQTVKPELIATKPKEKPARTVQKPLSFYKQMLRYAANGHIHRKQSVVFFNGLKKIIRDEFSLLSKETSLKLPLNIESPIVKYETIDAELREYAPTFKAVLEGACPTTDPRFKRPKRFANNKLIQLSITGIAMQAKSQKCNNFQKYVGLELLRVDASYGSFEVLQNFGVVCSHTTIKALMDQNQELPPEKRIKIRPRQKSRFYTTAGSRIKKEKGTDDTDSPSDSNSESDSDFEDSENGSNLDNSEISMNETPRIRTSVRTTVQAAKTLRTYSKIHKRPRIDITPAIEKSIGTTVVLTPTIKHEPGFEPEDIECVELSPDVSADSVNMANSTQTS